MRSWLMLLCGFVMFGTCQNGMAQGFKSAKARQAEQKFLRALKSAREAYIGNLQSAATLAAKANDVDEAIRIKEKVADLKAQQKGDRGDVVVKLRRNLTNTTWTFNRPGRPATIRFLPKNVVVLDGQQDLKGAWESLASDTAIANFGVDLFLFQFDKRVSAYKVRAFGPIETEYSTGQRTQ